MTGPACRPGALSDPRSSLHVLENHLRHFEGTLALGAGTAGGTLACARWRAQGKPR